MSLDVAEAMEELGIPENATPDQKLAAVCQWILGDPSWASQIKDWMRTSGFDVYPKT